MPPHRHISCLPRRRSALALLPCAAGLTLLFRLFSSLIGGLPAGILEPGVQPPCRLPELIPPDEAWRLDRDAMRRQSPGGELRGEDPQAQNAYEHGASYKTPTHNYRHFDFLRGCGARQKLRVDVSYYHAPSSHRLDVPVANSASGADGRTQHSVDRFLRVSGCASGDARFCFDCGGSARPHASAAVFGPSSAAEVNSSGAGAVAVPAAASVVQVWCRYANPLGSEGVPWGVDAEWVWRTLPLEPVPERAGGAIGAESEKKAMSTTKVLLLLLDSVSTRHFARSTPRLTAVLKKLEDTDQAKTFSFDLMHVVGWNSQENQMPLLSGSHWRTSKKPTDALYHCNSLWNEFSNHGFTTVHAEHGYWFPALKYFERRNSFCKAQASPDRKKQGPDRSLKQQYWIDEKWGCARTVESLTGYLKSLLHVRSRERIFASAYIPDPHSNFAPEYLQTLDEPLAEFYESGFDPSSTITVLVADHGLHFGPHLESFEGQLEHKLPLLKITVPISLLSIYPEVKHALTANAGRLVTHYDVHKTLGRIAQLLGSKVVKKRKLVAARSAVSLVDAEVDPLRTCEDADIPAAVCMCGGWDRIELTDATRELAAQAVSKINKETETSPCAMAEIFNVTSHERRPFKREKITAGELVRIKLSLRPQGDRNYVPAEFEVVLYRRATGGYDWHPALTGEVDIHYAHRLSPMKHWEKEAMRGTKSAAETKASAAFPLEWCIKSNA